MDDALDVNMELTKETPLQNEKSSFQSIVFDTAAAATATVEADTDATNPQGLSWGDMCVEELSEQWEKHEEETLERLRDDNRRRAEKFGTQYKEPSLKQRQLHGRHGRNGGNRKTSSSSDANKEVMDYREYSRIRYSNNKRERDSIRTGFDIYSEEERTRAEKRRERFNIKDDTPITTTTTTASPPVHVETEDNVFAPDDNAMDVEAEPSMRLEIQTDSAIRPEAVHLFGVDNMSTNDVLEYFNKYAPPSYVEWINDSSCNVVWDDKYSVQRAIIGMSEPFVSSSTDNDGSVETSTETFGGWRKAIPFKTRATSLQIRMARNGDIKKKGSARRSQFYAIYGRAGGLPDTSGKRRRKRQRMQEELMSIDTTDVDNVESIKFQGELFTNRDKFSNDFLEKIIKEERGGFQLPEKKRGRGHLQPSSMTERIFTEEMSIDTDDHTDVDNVESIKFQGELFTNRDKFSKDFLEKMFKEERGGLQLPEKKRGRGHLQPSSMTERILTEEKEAIVVTDFEFDKSIDPHQRTLKSRIGTHEYGSDSGVNEDIKLHSDGITDPMVMGSEDRVNVPVEPTIADRLGPPLLKSIRSAIMDADDHRVATINTGVGSILDRLGSAEDSGTIKARVGGWQ